MENLARPPVGTSRERVLSDDELKAVYKAAYARTSGFHRLICLLIHTGGRRGEITALKWAYIDREAITIGVGDEGPERHAAADIQSGVTRIGSH